MNEEKQLESVSLLETFDELLVHLKSTHKSSNKDISDWLNEYTGKHSEMDFRDHLWHLHTLHHYQWKGINHIHEKKDM